MNLLIVDDEVSLRDFLTIVFREGARKRPRRLPTPFVPTPPAPPPSRSASLPTQRPSPSRGRTTSADRPPSFAATARASRLMTREYLDAGPVEELAAVLAREKKLIGS